MIPSLFQQDMESLERQHGVDSLARVRKLLSSDPSTSNDERQVAQRTARYVLPGLRTGPWLDIQQYAELNKGCSALQAHHAEIKKEVLARVAKAPLVLYEGYLDKPNPKWRSIYLKKGGVDDETVAADFPVTRMLVEQYFSSQVYALGEVFFSALMPGAHIGAHSDMANFFICLHFGVSVPRECTLRVASETRTFAENEVYLFDHSFEHEAWNRSDEIRINLLFDVWHPDVTPVERKALAFFFRKLRDFMDEESS